MNKKILSILIPNYNHARYLTDCLSSVLQCPSQDLEILVIDDASTDNSIEIIESFAEKDPRIKVIKNDQNKGVNKTLNHGLSLVSGEYVFGLSADDRVLPLFFADMLPILKAHPEIDLCSSDFAYFDNDTPDKIERTQLLKTSEPYLILSPKDTLEIFRTTSFWIPGHTSIIRTALALKFGGYREELKHYSDFYLFHKIALTSPIAYIPKKLSAMRIVGGSYSSNCLANRQLRQAAQKNLLNRVLKDEAKDLFAKSTVLSPILRSYLFKAMLRPKYWPFIFHFIRKKLIYQ